MSRGTPLETYDRHGRQRWSMSRGRRRPDSGRRRRVKRVFRDRSRRGRSLIGPSLAALAVLAVVAAGLWWFLTRPAAVAFAASPPDAVISFVETSSVGALALEDLDPGTYTVVVERKGYETLERSIELARGRLTEMDFTLLPLPMEFSLASNPSGASYRLETSHGEVIVGDTPFVGEVPAGPLAITLEIADYNTYQRDLFVDEATDLELWMDPEGQVVHSLGVFECGPAPKGAAFTPDGSEVWVTLLAGPPSVEVYDPETGTLLHSFELGENGAVEVVFTADGATAYVSQMETARVYEIDVATREVRRTFETESSWSKFMAFSPDESRLFVSNWTADDVSEIDLETGDMVRRRDTVDTPRGLYVTEDGGALYVAGFGAGDLEKIDLQTGERERVFTGGTAMRHFAVDAEHGVLFVSDMGTDRIWRLDLATDSVTEFVTTDEKPNTIELSPDGRVLFVSCRGRNNETSYYLPGSEWGTVLLFDAETGQPLDAIVGGNQPTALAVSADGTRMIFSDFLDDRLRYYEIPEYETLAAGGGGLFGPHLALVQK